MKVKFKYLSERSLEMEAGGGVCFPLSDLEVWRSMKKNENRRKKIPRSAFLFILF